jgi:hypothetical protein
MEDEASKQLRASRNDGLKLYKKLKHNSVALVRKRTIPIERPPLVGEVSDNICG